MRNYFTLDGVDSRTFGLYISGQGTFDAPEREFNLLPVPGRDGDLIGLDTRLMNGKLTYADSFICRDFKANMAAFRAFLLSTAAYRRLIDTYHPDEYRLVTYAGPLEAEVTEKNDAGRFDLVFVAKPQRWLLSGETAITLTDSGSIENPTLFPARPLLRVYGTGTLGVGTRQIQILRAGAYTDIDLDTGMAYMGATSKNNDVNLGVELPVLAPGETGIALGEGITRVDITPRWWTV